MERRNDGDGSSALRAAESCSDLPARREGTTLLPQKSPSVGGCRAGLPERLPRGPLRVAGVESGVLRPPSRSRSPERLLAPASRRAPAALGWYFGGAAFLAVAATAGLMAIDHRTAAVSGANRPVPAAPAKPAPRPRAPVTVTRAPPAPEPPRSPAPP